MCAAKGAQSKEAGHCCFSPAARRSCSCKLALSPWGGPARQKRVYKGTEKSAIIDRNNRHCETVCHNYSRPTLEDGSIWQPGDALELDAQLVGSRRNRLCHLIATAAAPSFPSLHCLGKGPALMLSVELQSHDAKLHPKQAIADV